jgi:trk system potassium uptake protein TrkA
MKIIIVGGGVVGYSLAEHLEHEHHTISLLEKNPAACQAISEKLDIRIVCGTGTSPRLLERAGIKEAEMIIAVTPNDELNILACAIAKQYGVGTRIARIRSNEFRGGDASIDISEMGVTLVIDPESVVVDAIVQYVETPGATDAINFRGGNILMRGYKVAENMPIANKSLKEVRKETKEHPLLFIAAIRGGDGIIPHGDYIVEPNDDIFGIFSRSSIDTFLNLFNKTRKDVDNVIITGDSLTAVLLADALQNFVDKVILVDPDADHAREAADFLNNVEIVNGDCTESTIMTEVYVRNAKFFIAAGKEAEYNVMSALLAKAEGAREVIAVAADARYDTLFTSIGIDHVIHPRLTIAREILEAIDRGQIGRIARIRNLDIEAIRITAEENSPITGKPLQHVRSKIQKGSIIGTVLREDEMIIPDGSTVIHPGDQMIVITYTRNVARVRKLFKSR